MPVLAPDIQIGPNSPLPTGHVLGPATPVRIAETNNKATTLSIPTGALTAQTIDAYGTLSGSPTAVTPGPVLDGSQWQVAARVRGQ